MCRTDRECIEHCLDGRPDAFRHLVGRYQAVLVTYLAGHLGNREWAEEAAQEAFVRAYFALGKLKKPDSFFSWLLGIAGREAMLGAGVQRVGERLGATGTDFVLPDHTLFRVFGELELVEGVMLNGSVTNLFDTNWYANSYSSLWVIPGAPRTAMVSLQFAF